MGTSSSPAAGGHEQTMQPTVAAPGASTVSTPRGNAARNGPRGSTPGSLALRGAGRAVRAREVRAPAAAGAADDVARVVLGRPRVVRVLVGAQVAVVDRLHA